MNNQQALGKFYTPDNLALAMVKAVACLINKPVKWVLEPSVGDGAFVRAARFVWPDCKVIGVDIDPDAPGLALCDERFVCDFLKYYQQPKVLQFQADVVIGNPPFSVGEWRDYGPKRPSGKAECIEKRGDTYFKLIKTEVAESHVRQSFSHTVCGGTVAMLLPAGFLHAASRDELLRSLEIELKINPRPPFAPDGGTDNRDYSAFLWQNTSPGCEYRRPPGRLWWDKPSRKQK
jgi:N-6 DNA Methylase